MDKLSEREQRRKRVVAQFGSALDWGSRGRRFKSCQPDQHFEGSAKAGPFCLFGRIAILSFRDIDPSFAQKTRFGGRFDADLSAKSLFLRRRSPRRPPNPGFRSRCGPIGLVSSVKSPFLRKKASGLIPPQSMRLSVAFWSYRGYCGD